MSDTRDRLIRIFAEEAAKLLRKALRKTKYGEPPACDAEFERVCFDQVTDMVRGFKAHDVEQMAALPDEQIREAFQAICEPDLMTYAAKDFVS